jgi:hypothetical protein
MTWVNMDDNFHNHPKAIAAGPEGRDLYQASLGYCSRLLTDGHIPAAIVKHPAPGLKRPTAIAARLVKVGLWETTSNGFQIHDYLDWNRSASEIKSKRESNRRRQAEWRQTHENAANPSERNALRNALVIEPTPLPASPASSSKASKPTSTATTPRLGAEPPNPRDDDFLDGPGEAATEAAPAASLEATPETTPEATADTIEAQFTVDERKARWAVFSPLWGQIPKRISRGEWSKTEAWRVWLRLGFTEADAAAMKRVLARTEPGEFYDAEGEPVVTPAEWLAAWPEAQRAGLDNPLALFT